MSPPEDVVEEIRSSPDIIPESPVASPSLLTEVGEVYKCERTEQEITRTEQHGNRSRTEQPGEV